MNKNRVNKLLPKAIEALKVVEIANEDGTINKTYRGQIASFGAAVVMGSLPAAVAFFADQGSATVDRSKLLKAIHYCLTNEVEKPQKIFNSIKNDNSPKTKEDYVNAAIALKLAMNLYALEENNSGKEKNKEPENGKSENEKSESSV